MKKLNFGRIFLAGIVYAIIAQVIHIAGAFLTMNFYTMEAYFQIWSRIMMPTAGPPPASFYYYSFIFSLITGIFFALVYSVIREGIPAKTSGQKGLIYAILVILLAAIPGSLSMILLINLPSMLVLYWFIEMALIYFINGWIVSRMIK